MRIASIFLLLVAALGSSAASGKELIVGQTSAFSIDPQKVAQSFKAGVELYFEVLNKSGGIHGNTLKLAARDRGAESAAAVKVTRELLQELKPIALIGLTGTGPMEALVRERVLEQAAVPVVGIRTGARSLHEPVNPWLFHTRADYAAEARKIVQYLATVGHKRIAVFHENTAFGREGLAHVTKALLERGMSPVATGTYEQFTTDVRVATERIASGGPGAVVAVGSSNAVAEFYKALKGRAQHIPVVAMSTVDAGSVVKRIGKEVAHGLAIVRVVPDPQNKRSPLVREFQDAAQRLRGGQLDLNQAELEGYVAAKVLAQGLRLAGPNPTPAKLRAALELIRDFDIGGIIIEFSDGNHSGTTYVDIGMLSRNGKMVQ